MDTKNLESKLEELKGLVETLILLELCKIGATHDQARKVLGAVSNETYAKVNGLFSSKQKK